MLLIASVLFSCSNDQLCYEHRNDDAIETVKSDLVQLNVSYQSKQTRAPKWLRWLIFGAADVAGAIYGGVGGACSASTLAWTITKPEMSTKTDYKDNTIQNAPVLKENNLQGISPETAGYTHNAVINSAFTLNEDLDKLNNEDVLSIVFQALENETGTYLSNIEKNDIVEYTNMIVNTFDTNKSIEEYFEDLKSQTIDQQKKEALDVCKLILDGLQYVNDSDTTYVTAATDIILNSNLNIEQKKTLIDGVSVANASAKLWNTGEIATIPEK